MASRRFLVHLQVLALSDFRTKTDGCRLRSVQWSQHILIPYVRKSSTVKQQNNEKQPYATGGIVHFRNFDTSPRYGLHSWALKRKGLLSHSLTRELNIVLQAESLRRSPQCLSPPDIDVLTKRYLVPVENYRDV